MESNVFLYAEILKVHSCRLESDETFGIPTQTVLKIRLFVSSNVYALVNIYRQTKFLTVRNVKM